MGYVTVKYLILIRKVLFFLMRVTLFGFRLCKRKETFLNGKTLYGHDNALVYILCTLNLAIVLYG